MSGPFVGKSRDDTFAIGWRNDGEHPRIHFSIGRGEAAWICAQLIDLLGWRNFERERDELAEEVAALRRSNAALRGALARKKGSGG